MNVRFKHVCHRSLEILTCALFALAVAYQFIGFRSLLFGIGESVPVDFRLRWVESLLLIEGKDSHTYGHPDPALPPSLHGQRTMGGYPPFSTAFGLLLAPPLPWPIARSYFALLNLAGLIAITSWAYQIGAAHGPRFGLFLMAASLACAPAAICVSYGQYGVLITALLLCAVDCLQRHKQVAAGLALGLGLVKPQLVGISVLAILLRRHFVATAVAVIVVVSGCLVFWAATGINPVTAMANSKQDTQTFAFMSVNPLTTYLLPILGFESTTKALGILFSLLGAALALAARQGIRLVTLFALCTILSMFWSYRRGYDCVLLIIPMVLLFDAALARGSAALWGVGFLFGMSLWLPIRNEQWNWVAVQIFQSCTWLLGGAALAFNDIQGYVGSPGRRLDYECGAGYFVKTAQNK